ncbi:MAG TPA: IS21 family transposase, partial [Myxococcales bacterium]|nr:IS21 family transposase [Myxococcales bacterium]
MISPEQRADIRRLYFAERWRIGTIATTLGLHHNTVRSAIEADRFVRTGAQIRPTALDAYKPFLLATLEQYPRLRATRLYAMLRERGFPGSAVQVRRWVRTVRPAARAEAYLRLETLPGEQGQVDWGNFGPLPIGRARRTLSCFVLVLSWSRAVYARFALDQTLESFLRGHVEAFAALGGVPRTLLYDNLKSVVLERQGDHIRFHPRVLELAGHYHFAPQPCAPYRGNEKGKVERMIQYLRHSFFAARRFSSLEDLNGQLTRWIAEVAHVRTLPGGAGDRLVREALEAERPRLLPLPEHPFGCDLLRAVASGKTPYVHFDGNDYSIPHALVRRPLTLVASETLVRVLDGATEVARHARSYDRGQRLEDPAHLAVLAREKRRAHELRGRDRLRAACVYADALLDALARRGEPLAPHTSALLRLLDQYGAPALDWALNEALARSAVSAVSVAHLLDQRARA